MDYHVRGIAKDTGVNVEFNVRACDEQHVIELAESQRIMPEEIELIAEGLQEERPRAALPPPASPDQSH